MKKDTINSYEWSIYDESNLEQARADENNGNPRVLIATTCDECGEPIQAQVTQIDNRGEEPIRHTSAYHDMFDLPQSRYNS